MRLASSKCPACRLPYDAITVDDAFTAPCPQCGQNNRLIAGSSKPITGRCSACNKPVDDHEHVVDDYGRICPVAV